jgi:hypothetical protein
MNQVEYIINTRTLTASLPLTDELSYKSNTNYLFDLSYLGCLDVIGSQGHDFLQGQLSCDMREVSTKLMRQSALCNLKGRVLGLLDVVDWNGLHLIMPRDLIIATQASLTKPALFSQVKFESSLNYQLFGFHLQNPTDQIPFNAILPAEQWAVIHENNQYCCYHLGSGYYIFIAQQSLVHTMCAPFIHSGQWRGSLGWHALQLHQKRISIYPLSRGLFLPHRLDLHRSGYLNFKKGCYKGQEIIARMHYRAKCKHQLALFIIETNATLQSGLKLLNHEQIEVGELIDYCPIDDHRFLCAASVMLDYTDIVFMESTSFPLHSVVRLSD